MSEPVNEELRERAEDALVAALAESRPARLSKSVWRQSDEVVEAFVTALRSLPPAERLAIVGVEDVVVRKAMQSPGLYVQGFVRVALPEEEASGGEVHCEEHCPECSGYGHG